MSATVPSAPRAAEVLARARRENFPVASLLFPKRVRPHLMAIYGFARLADDIGDEAEGDRTELLGWLSSELDAVYGPRTPAHELMGALAPTVAAFDLPREPFDRLIEANRRDQVAHRYETFGALREYCALSADPVGELVLRVLEAWTPERAALSDATCTGLQLVEFWQDLGEDAARGRVYVPLGDMDRFGYRVEELLAGTRNEAFVTLMRFEAARTRAFLERGRPLARTLPGRAGLAVRLFTAGGVAALEDLERRGFDTLSASAHASRARRAWAAGRELLRPAAVREVAG
ncbi:MAG TPA: squalene synthase HpnC [Actinomycetota bacterium]